MNTSISIRMASPEDVPAMLEIYRPFVVHTHTSFEYEVPTETEFLKRLQKTLSKTPWIVATDGKEIAGYAYAGEHRGRTAYQWSVESSIYLHPNWRKRGLGKRLYAVLLDLLSLQGYMNVYAGIGLPNDPSLKFHECFGFKEIGTYDNIGFKSGRWVSNSWWQKQLNEYPDSPIAPITWHHIPEEQLQKILNSY